MRASELVFLYSVTSITNEGLGGFEPWFELFMCMHRTWEVTAHTLVRSEDASDRSNALLFVSQESLRHRMQRQPVDKCQVA